MPLPPFMRDTTAFHVFRAARALGSRFRQSVHGQGMNRTRGAILMQLAHTPDGMTATALRKCVDITAASMSKTLTEMERAGLIRRAPNPADARSMLVYITEDAAEMQRRYPEMVRAVEKDALAGFSEEEIQQLIGLLSRIVRNLGDDEMEDFHETGELVKEEQNID
ncbi:MarR family winged helix-turn-helix transcriptional regulator [Chloroflexota bacterium]